MAGKMCSVFISGVVLYSCEGVQCLYFMGSFMQLGRCLTENIMNIASLSSKQLKLLV